MIEVTVKTLDGKNRAFSVPDEITVKQFKKTIAASIEIKAEIQRLIFKGRILKDEMKINDYDVNGKTIHVVQKIPPASTPTPSTVTVSTSSDSQPQQSWEADEPISRLGRRFFLGSYTLPSDTAVNNSIQEIVQQMLDDFSEPSNRGGSRTQNQNAENSSASEANNVAGSSQNQSQNEAQSRIIQIKKLIASAKQSLDLLESPNAESDASLDDAPAEQNDQADERSDSTEQGTSTENPTNQNDFTGAQDPLSSSVLADTLDDLMLINERLHPHLMLYQQLMRDNTVYRKKTRKHDNAQRLCNLVLRVMHYVGHIYHNLSDLTICMNSPLIRRLGAPAAPSRRPTAIIQQTIPVLQAEISLSGTPLMTSGDHTTPTTSMTPGTTRVASTAAQTETTNAELGNSKTQPTSVRPQARRPAAGSQTPASSSTTTTSSMYPLFFSSALGNSYLSSMANPLTPSTTSNVAPSSTVSTPGTATRSETRRGFRRYSTMTRNRPTTSISSLDIREPGLRHIDPYLPCHSRHFQNRCPAQQSRSSARNSNQSFADIISNLVSSIMTTSGEPSVEVSSNGRQGADVSGSEAATSFSRTFELSQPLNVLDDPEVEEEVISSWHPIDADNPLVRNIFGSSSERHSDSERTEDVHRPAASSLADFISLMSGRLSGVGGENWLESLFRCVLDNFSYGDLTRVLSGTIEPLNRLRQPLRTFIISTVLSGEDATEENLNHAIDRLTEDMLFDLEDVTCEVEALMEVDFTASLSSFIKHHLKQIFSMIMNSTEESHFNQELYNLCWQMVTEFVCLCKGCLNDDGFITFTQNRLRFLPSGFHSAIREWIRDQLLLFQQSILPSPLQSAVYERHIVFNQPTNLESMSDATATAENSRKDSEENIKNNGQATQSEVVDAIASPNESVPISSSVDIPVQVATTPIDLEERRKGRKMLRGNDDEVERITVKRSRLSVCDGQNDGSPIDTRECLTNGVGQDVSDRVDSSIQDIASTSRLSEDICNAMK